MKIIRDGLVLEDSWTTIADADPVPAGGHAIVSLGRWNEQRDALLAGGLPIGVLLEPSEQPKDIVDLDRAAMVAVRFPAFTDGRGYTSARLLRTRFGYRGEIRAVGDVLRDQLLYMKRCGIDSFALKPGKDIEGALEAFGEFSVAYQGAADDPRPLFRRVHRDA